MRSKHFFCMAVLLLAFVPQVVIAQWTGVGTGIDYQEFNLPDPNNVFVARMDRTETDAFIESSIGQGRLSGGTEIMTSQADRYDDAIGYWGQTWGNRNDVIIAINGSYYNTSTGVPESGVIHSGWYAKRFNNVSGMSGFFWDLNRNAAIGECITHYANKQLITYVTDGSATQQFQGINKTPGSNELIVFTPQYDEDTGTDNSGSEVLVELTTRPALLIPTPSMVTGVIKEVRQSAGSTPLPFDHVVLSARGSAETTLLSYADVGDTIGISQEIKNFESDCSTPRSLDWTKAYGSVSGNWVFLKDSVIQYGIDPSGDRHPRTAIALNSSYVFYIVCDGRDPGTSIGMTIDELAEFCKNTLGATWACNQDGGGSSTMVVNGTVMNNPSDGSQRSVANGMLMCNLVAKSQTSTFAADDPVTTTASANVRLGPGTNYAVITTVGSGAEGTIVDHSMNGVAAKGYNWWKVDFSGTVGWVAEFLLSGGCTPPSITQHPSNQTVAPGETAVFTVAATGDAPLSYQWQKNQSDISDGGHYSGCTTATLTVSNCDSGDAGNYRCVVTNSCGSATSNEATLTVTSGGECLLNAGFEDGFVSGVGVNWIKFNMVGDVACASSTDAYSGVYAQKVTCEGYEQGGVYQQFDVTPGNPYTVAVWIKCLSAGGVQGFLGVDPYGGTDPNSGNIWWGSKPYDYYSQKTWNGTALGASGKITVFLRAQETRAEETGEVFFDEVTPACGPAPVITQQPVPQNVCAGETATFSVTATGTGTLYYQWQKDLSDLTDGGNISGATTDTLQVSNAQAADEGDYRCVVTDDNGSTNSDAAALTLKADTTITQDPTNQTVGAGQTAQFTVTATGAGTLTYQWQKDLSDLTDGGDISGATTDTLQIANVEPTDEGSYRCVVTGDCGTATSASATLTVTTWFIVESRPGGQNYSNYSDSGLSDSALKSTAEGTTAGIGCREGLLKCKGGPRSATFSFTPSSSGTYEVSATWAGSSKNYNVVEHIVTHDGGSTSVLVDQTTGANVWNSLGQFDLTASTNYTVTITTETHCLPSPGAKDVFQADAVKWEPAGGPTITQQPSPQDVCTGNTATFTVAATGEGTLTYQWQKDQTNLSDGGDISGATTTTLQILNADSADEGNYRCVVTDNTGSTNSDEAALTIADTTITQHPSDQNVPAGGTATFTVAATGKGMLTYQWQKDLSDLTDGGDISGATTDTLQIVNVETADEGSYRCVVTGDCGSANSNGATLTVVAGPTTCHVDSIVLSEVSAGGPNRYGRATVTIVDNLGSPVVGADVTGTFTGDVTGTYTETTDDNGVAVLTTTNYAKKPSFTFCVDDVVHATLTYNPDDNVETCDSY